MFIKNLKKTLAMFLAFLLILASVPASAFAATTHSLLDGKVSVTDSVGTGKSSGSTVTITATGGTLSKTTNNITITNESDKMATIAFDYNVDNADSYNVNGITNVTNGSTSKLLNPGDTISITIVSKRFKGVVTLTLSNFTFVEAAATSTITFSYDDTLGNITVGGEVIASEATKEINTGESVVLVATPISGARFIGWVNTNDSKIISTSPTYTYQAVSNISFNAVFVNKDSAPHFSVINNSNTYIFNNLNSASTFASSTSSKTVVLLNDATLPAGNYTIPSGVTLLIPFDSANTLYTTKPASTGTDYYTPTIYRQLTMSEGANITVNGAMSLSAKYKSGAGAKVGTGAPSGPCSFVNMQSGSSITVNGALYAWGFVTGEGTITAKSGAKVYENFQFQDWRGGDGTTKIKNDVFPISQYYVQNIEVPLTIESGATEYSFTSVTVTLLGEQSASVGFFGTSGAMFNLSSGSITKRYDGTTDRMIIDVDGDMSISPIAMKMGIYSIDTSKYNLAINGNISVNVNDGSSVTIDQSIAMLPGAEINVNKGANCFVAEGTKIYIYDADEWGNYCGAVNATMLEVSYAPSKEYTRDISQDATVRIDGYVDASKGYIYTTEGGANVYSTGTGVAKISRGTETITYQAIQKSDNTHDYDEISITPVKLKNADGTYVDTNCPTGTYTYTNGSWDYECEHVYTTAVTTAPGCETKGVKTFTCPCGNSYTEDIAATGHTAGDDATCTTAQTCTVCGKEITAALGHTEVIDAAVAPTCTQTGLTEGKHCSVCNTVIVAQETVPVSKHNYNSVTDITPDCGNQGQVTYTCSDCGYSYTELLPVTGEHTYKSEVTTVPSCITDGLCTYTCSVCGDNYTEIIPAADHTEVIDSAVEATCIQTGLTEGKHCSVCNEVLIAQDTVAALGHNHKAVVTYPTCTEEGYTIYTCACGDTYIADETAALGHDHYVGDDGNEYCYNCDYGNVAHMDFVNGVYVNGYGWGDLNNDGYINYTDLEMLNKVVCNALFGKNNNVCKAADVNGDGIIDMKDIIRIKKIIGIIPGGGVGDYSTLTNIPNFMH